MCWQREGGIGDDGDGGREDSLNADGDDDAHSYVGCKDAKGVASGGRFEKGSPKLFGQGQGTGLGSLGPTRATTRVHPVCFNWDRLIGTISKFWDI